MGKIKITIILVNIKIPIIQTNIFEFENMYFFQHVSTQRYVSSCSALSIKDQIQNIYISRKNRLLILWPLDAKIKISIKLQLIAQPYFKGLPRMWLNALATQINLILQNHSFERFQNQGFKHTYFQNAMHLSLKS